MAMGPKRQQYTHGSIAKLAWLLGWRMVYQKMKNPWEVDQYEARSVVAFPHTHYCIVLHYAVLRDHAEFFPRRPMTVAPVAA
jgi:hypothetical protein